MDKRRVLKTFATLSLMVIGFAALRANGPLALHAQSWLADDKAAQFEILSQPYAKAPAHFANREEERAYQIGEALFRTPIVLGGQAAKARISCNSCHLSGGDNAHFLFPNISGAAGTADVSNSFFSSFRGNQNFDPVVIPNLRKKGKISVHNEAELRAFIYGLIVEEFNGNIPSKEAMDALIVYLQKIAPNNIKADANEAQSTQKDSNILSVRDPIRIIEQSIDNIEYNVKNDDPNMAVLLIAAIRHQMGLIHERYQHPQLENTQIKLLNLSQKLALISNILRDKNSGNAARLMRLKQWNQEFQTVRTELIKNENLSLYSPENLRSSL